jgi:hypothetical protein
MCYGARGLALNSPSKDSLPRCNSPAYSSPQPFPGPLWWRQLWQFTSPHTCQPDAPYWCSLPVTMGVDCNILAPCCNIRMPWSICLSIYLSILLRDTFFIWRRISFLYSTYIAHKKVYIDFSAQKMSIASFNLYCLTDRRINYETL